MKKLWNQFKQTISKAYYESSYLLCARERNLYI